MPLLLLLLLVIVVGAVPATQLLLPLLHARGGASLPGTHQSSGSRANALTNGCRLGSAHSADGWRPTSPTVSRRSRARGVTKTGRGLRGQDKRLDEPVAAEVSLLLVNAPAPLAA